MSASLRAPWICDYLINVAETYGGNLTAVPPETKAKRAQLIKFLTFPRKSEPDACIWALLSDQKHIIHICLNSEAMKTYRQNPNFAGKSVTDHKTAFVSINTFTPLFRRIPLEGKGMSSNETIALDVGCFQLRGSYDEGVWGSPVAVESNPSIGEWVVAMRESGGGGNVLKLRKKEHAQEDVSIIAKTSMPVQVKLPAPNPFKVRVSGARKTALKSPSPPSKQTYRATSQREWERKWHPERHNRRLICPTNLQLFRSTFGKHSASIQGHAEDSHETTLSPVIVPSTPRLPSKHRRDPLALSSSPQAPSDSGHGPEDLSGSTEDNKIPIPATPSNWSPSVRGSPDRSLPQATFENDDSPKGEPSVAVEEDGPHVATQQSPSVPRESSPVAKPSADPYNTFSPSLSAPTPAQRPRPKSPSHIHPHSSSPTMSSARIAPLSTKSASSNAVHPSSSAPPAPSGSLHPPLQRRVPLPFVSRAKRSLTPAEARLTESGQGKILVPNSDTSGTTSQGPSQQSLSYTGSSQQKKQNQSHDQSQSQSQSQSQGRSQVTTGSQLRNEIQSSPSDVRPRNIMQTDIPMDVQVASSPAVRAPTSSPRVPPTTLITETETSNEQQPSPALSPPAAHEESSSEAEEDDADDELDAEEVDVDELASESSAQHAEPLVQEKATGDIDSDDERTREMVDRHVPEVRGVPAPAQMTDGPSSENHTPSSRRTVSPIAKPWKRRKGSNLAPRPLRLDQESSDGPVCPSRPDVFISEASFRASQDQDARRAKKQSRQSSESGSQSRKPPQPLLSDSDDASNPAVSPKRPSPTKPAQLYHDPQAWEVPAFMRKERSKAQEKVGVKETPAANVENTFVRKRRTRSPPSAENPPLKRQKLSNESEGTAAAADARLAQPHAHPAACEATSFVAPSSGSHRPREPVPEPIIGRVDLSRSGSTTSSLSSGRRLKMPGSGRSSVRSTSSKPEIRMIKTTVPGTATPVEIAHVTFPTSRSSSLSKRRPAMSEPSRPPSSGSERPGSRLGAIPESAGDDGSSSVVKPMPEKAVPAVLGRRGNVHRSSSQAPAPQVPATRELESRRPLEDGPLNDAAPKSRSRAVPAVSSSSAGSHSETRAASTSRSVPPARPDGPYLGFRVDLDLQREACGLPLLAWTDLQRIVLDTGRRRFQASEEGRARRQGGG